MTPWTLFPGPVWWVHGVIAAALLLCLVRRPRLAPLVAGLWAFWWLVVEQPHLDAGCALLSMGAIWSYTLHQGHKRRRKAVQGS